jgi:uncharacterized protein YhbP (UPF0306 family)
MEKRIARFLRKHHVLTLSTTGGESSWSAHVFYAYMHDHEALVFTSDPKTRHGREMLENPSVSGGIVLETKVVGKIRGIQLTGKVALLEMKDERIKNKELDKDDEEERLKISHQSPVTHHSSLITSSASRITHHSLRAAYLKRFPYAIATKLDLWVLELEYVKMTDNRLGFGTKLEWRKETKD